MTAAPERPTFPKSDLSPEDFVPVMTLAGTYAPALVELLDNEHQYNLKLWSEAVEAFYGEPDPEEARAELTPLAQAELVKLEAREAAKLFYTAERASRSATPDGLTLGDFLALELEPEAFVIDGILHTDGNVVFSAQRKAGKTTVTHNLVRSLVDGDPFLDHFTVDQTRRVAVLDFELSKGNLQRWLRAQNIQNADAVEVFSLRGKAGSFNILDDRVRAQWARKLSGFDVLILDPLRPIMDALGLDERSEAGVILQAFDALKEEAGTHEGVVVTHHGHGSEHARGDSRIEDWPDAIWRLTRDDATDPQALRYFDAYGRDVLVDKGIVSLTGDHFLTFNPDASAGKSERLVSAIVDALIGKGELKTAEVINLGIRGVSKNTVSALLAAGVESGAMTLRADGVSKYYSASLDRHPF